MATLCLIPENETGHGSIATGEKGHHHRAGCSTKLFIGRLSTLTKPQLKHFVGQTRFSVLNPSSVTCSATGESPFPATLSVGTWEEPVEA